MSFDDVVARVEGADRSRPALLIHGHLDVVPARAADWRVDPFGGEELDGCLWGRGANCERHSRQPCKLDRQAARMMQRQADRATSIEVGRGERRGRARGRYPNMRW